MYNRYIPQPDGSYRRNTVIDSECAPPPPPRKDSPPHKDPPPENCPPPPPPPRPDPPKREPSCPQKEPAGDFLSRLLPKNLDTGDLIVILLLLLMAGDCQEDRNMALLTLAIYLFL